MLSRLRHFIVIAAAMLMVTILPACNIITPLVQQAEFKVVSASPTEGITVSVRGNECNFSFTTDKAVLYKEVKACAFRGIVMSSPTIYDEDGNEIVLPPEPIDPVLEGYADDILEQIKKNE